MASVDDPESWHLFATPNDELQKMLQDGVKPRLVQDYELSSLPDTRVRYHAIFEADAQAVVDSARDEITQEELFIPVRDGSQVRALLYKPKLVQPEGHPLVVLLHGGGFILGNAEMEAPACVHAAHQLSCVAISLEYRLSPEVRFPVAYDDCWDALLWVKENAASLNADPRQGFLFGGSSAGSHLAIPLMHRYRDEKQTPIITGAWLSVPPALPPQTLIDRYRPFYRSRQALANGSSLSSKATDLFDEAVKPDFQSPYWSPLLWPTGHADLPPTFFQIAGADLLRDEALIYERELRLDGNVKTKVIVYKGMPHIFWYNYPTHSASNAYHKDTINGFRWLLGHDSLSKA